MEHKHTFQWVKLLSGVYGWVCWSCGDINPDQDILDDGEWVTAPKRATICLPDDERVIEWP